MMGINTIGANRKYPSDKMIEHAVGFKDDYGAPFTIIPLQATVVVGTYSKERGYQDATVQMIDGEPHISYGEPGMGKITWYRAEFGKWRIGKLAKTPHNMRVLSSCYYDGRWKITDPLIDAEVKAMADKDIAAMTEEERAEDQKRIEAMHSRLDTGALHTYAQDEKSKKERDLYLKERELARKELELKAREEELNKKTVEVAVADVPLYTEEMLRKMKQPVLRGIVARVVKAETPKNISSEALIAQILEFQAKTALVPEEVIQ